MKNGGDVLYVEILEAKPNKLFTEDQRSTVRFLRYNRSIPCAECGRKRRIHWTLLCSFKAASLKPQLFVPYDSGKIHLPLAPVCQQHLLAVAWDEPEKKTEVSANAEQQS